MEKNDIEKKSNMKEMNEIQQQARHQYLAMAMVAIHKTLIRSMFKMKLNFIFPNDGCW